MPFGNLKLLIAEDSLVSRAIYEQQIHRRKPDYRIEVCSTLAECIEKACSMQPNLVILDLNLIDAGIEESLKAIPIIKQCGCKVLATTADTDPNIEERCLQAGADGFMPKILGETSSVFVKRITDLCTG